MSRAKNSSRVDNKDVCSVDRGRLHSRWLSHQTATTHECLGPAWLHCTILISPGKLTKSSEHHWVYSSAPRRGQRRPCKASRGKVPVEAGAGSRAGGFLPSWAGSWLSAGSSAPRTAPGAHTGHLERSDLLSHQSTFFPLNRCIKGLFFGKLAVPRGYDPTRITLGGIGSSERVFLKIEGDFHFADLQVFPSS